MKLQVYEKVFSSVVRGIQ